MLIWIGFIALIVLFLALDLGVFNREPHVISTREALGWTGLWVSTSLLFSIFIYYGYEYNLLGLGQEIGNPLSGNEAVMKYLTGYIIEQSLSVDNIFVIVMVFAYFRVPQLFQHRILFWGILGAIFFRGVMIGVGTWLINHISWITYFFGALLFYSAFRMWRSGDEQVEIENNPVVKFAKRFFPVYDKIESDKFFIVREGVKMATPLFIALIVVETTDVFFALDSIPAIFAITSDPFIVFSSNIFAILGLRSLYFVLASIIGRFKYLQLSLVFILGFVGVKMILLHIVHLPEWVSLTVIGSILAIGVIASLLSDEEEEKNTGEDSSEKDAID